MQNERKHKVETFRLVIYMHKYIDIYTSRFGLHGEQTTETIK